MSFMVENPLNSSMRGKTNNKTENFSLGPGAAARGPLEHNGTAKSIRNKNSSSGPALRNSSGESLRKV